MSLTDLDCARLVAAQYAGDTSPFDVWISEGHPSWRSVAWAAKVVGDHVVFVLEGSHDGYDWGRDAQFLPVWVNGAHLHAGFWANMPETWEMMKGFRAMTGAPVIFCGHSLGAAHADDLAWLALQDDYDVRALIRWGEPAPSYNSVLGGALSVIPIRRSYINERPAPRWPDQQDPIPALPLKIFGAKHPDQFTPIFAGPTGDDLLRWHHFGTVAGGGGYLSMTPKAFILP